MRTNRIGKRGTWVIPVELRKRYGLEEGDPVIVEETTEGILLKPASVVPRETYTPERKAEFLLTSAVDGEDYRDARETVRDLGLDPDEVPHTPPGE